MEQKTYLLYVDSNGQQYKAYSCEGESTEAVIHKYIGSNVSVWQITGEVKIFYDEEAVIQGKTLNRALFNNSGKLITVFAGSILVVGDVEAAVESINLLKPIERIFAGEVFTRDVLSLPIYQKD